MSDMLSRKEVPFWKEPLTVRMRVLLWVAPLPILTLLIIAVLLLFIPSPQN
jgi:hypothetical protein